MLIVFIFLTITALTAALLYLIIKYLDEKPFGRLSVTDYLCYDLVQGLMLKNICSYWRH